MERHKDNRREGVRIGYGQYIAGSERWNPSKEMSKVAWDARRGKKWELLFPQCVPAEQKSEGNCGDQYIQKMVLPVKTS